MVQVFMLREAGLVRRWLRRYQLSGDGGRCGCCPGGYHHAMALVGDFPEVTLRFPEDNRRYTAQAPPASDYAGDLRWPVHAPCGYAFTHRDERQVFQRTLYTLPDGTLTTLPDAPPGACWDAWWFPRKGPDGRSLVVKLPNGREWFIDSRASNCTMPDDHEHRCWVRHGTPEDGTLHVDKQGLTCAAGAGSIVSGDYHGFLHHGRFTGC